MNIPDQFILAFPNGCGNTWEHYDYLAIDVGKRIMHVSRSKWADACLWDDFGCAFRYDDIWSGKEIFCSFSEPATILWASRCSQKKSNRDNDIITNGQTRKVFHFQFKELTVKFNKCTPIRFCPVIYDAFTGLEDRNKTSEWDSLIADLSDDIHGRESGFSLLARTKMGHIIYSFKGSDEQWNIFMDKSKKLLSIMSSSQVKFSIDKSSKCRARMKSWRRYVWDATNNMLQNRLHKFNSGNDIKSTMFQLGILSEKTPFEIIKKSISRFIRRNPTRATTNLLQMLATSFKLKRITTI